VNFLRKLLGIGNERIPIALVCVAKKKGETGPMKRKPVKDKTSYMS
jgi:hypothetical protein